MTNVFLWQWCFICSEGMHSVKWKKIGRRTHIKNESGVQNWKTTCGKRAWLSENLLLQVFQNPGKGTGLRCAVSRWKLWLWFEFCFVFLLNMSWICGRVLIWQATLLCGSIFSILFSWLVISWMQIARVYKVHGDPNFFPTSEMWPDFLPRL